MNDDDVLSGAFRIPHDDPPRWLLMLTAYIDETGQEQDDWMFMAGFYGTDDSWRGVKRAWPESLGNQRANLHMSQLRFKRESERKMLERAGAIPSEFHLVPMIGGVRRGDYRDLIQGTPDDVAMNGYVVCLWAMLYDTLRCLPDGERLEIVFEEQERYARYADIAMRVFTRNPPPETLLPDGRPKLANWRWVPKFSTPLLELADYLCFALAKFHKERGSIKDQWCRPIMNQGNGPGSGAILSRDQVREAIANGMQERIRDMQKGIGL